MEVQAGEGTRVLVQHVNAFFKVIGQLSPYLTFERGSSERS
jgi:hypothetical protein